MALPRRIGTQRSFQIEPLRSPYRKFAIDESEHVRVGTSHVVADTMVD